MLTCCKIRNTLTWKDRDQGYRTMLGIPYYREQTLIGIFFD